jgi:NADH dehydrogenase
VLLIEAGPRVLPAFSPELAEKTVMQLAELGVHVRTGTMVDAIGPRGVRLQTGETLLADTVVWAAGVACSPLIRALTPAIEVDRQGRALVGKDCSVPNFPRSFVIGDAACFLGADGKPLPGVSPTAMQMGRFVAAIIAKEARTTVVGERPEFVYHDKGAMATIGRSRAVAEAKGMKLSGVLAWLAWLLVHIWYLVGFRNRFLVFFDWAWSYFTYRRGARLITGGRLLPGAPEAHALASGRASRPPNDLHNSAAQ